VTGLADDVLTVESPNVRVKLSRIATRLPGKSGRQVVSLRAADHDRAITLLMAYLSLPASSQEERDKGTGGCARTA
jgi:hypothetical protein